MLSQRDLWASALEFSGEPGGDAEDYIADMAADGEQDAVRIVELVRHRMRRLLETPPALWH